MKCTVNSRRIVLQDFGSQPTYLRELSIFVPTWVVVTDRGLVSELSIACT